MIEITDSLKNETTEWADQVIERFKTAMRSGETYLRWNNPLMYRKGGDAWVAESWWIETARVLFEEQDRKYEGLGGIPALEILVFHYPEQFKKIALTKIDTWHEKYGLVDPEYWYDIAALTDMNHPFLLECLQHIDWEDMAVLANMGHLKAINLCRDWLEDSLEEVSESNFNFVWLFLDKLDRQVILEILSEETTHQIYKEAKEIALKKRIRDTYNHDLILLTAIKLGWEDVIDELSKNLEFFYFDSGGTDFISSETILEWSLSSKKFFTQQLVLISKKTAKDILEQYIQLAIAWKRSLET